MAFEQIQNLNDFKLKARQILPRMFFDYIDGGSGDGGATERNASELSKILLQPRGLINVEGREQKKSIFGQEWSHPFGISPMGMCNMSREKADLHLAKLAAKKNIPICISTAASTSLEQISVLAKGNAWFQLYAGQSTELSFQLVERAKKAGIQNLILTVDVPSPGNRPRERRDGFKLPFVIGLRQFLDLALHPGWSLRMLINGIPKLAHLQESVNADVPVFDRYSGRGAVDLKFLKTLRKKWQGNLIVKGVMHPSDALNAVNCGVDGIYISNHGGRQLESAPAAITALRNIKEVVGSNIPILFDSGIRSGEDIIKALSLGADFVFLGRPFLFATSVGGLKGAEHLVKLLAAEIDTTLAQIGKRDVESLGITNIATI